MRATPISRARRRGLSLLEVLMALAIFLISLIGISQLLSDSSHRAVEAREVGQATILCQGDMAQVMAGVMPMSSQGDTPCDEDPTINGRWTVSKTRSPTSGPSK